MLPLNVIGKCVADDEELFANMDAAIARGLPEVLEPGAIKQGVIALCASGPSIAGQLELIKLMKAGGTPTVAIKDTHDWLITQGVTPNYAFAIDPQEHRWNCFSLRNLNVHYMIASQCNPTMFDRLAGHSVTIWHPYVTKGQKRPKNRMTIGGGTTSGLRAISLFYVLGWRHFALFGFDSCMDADKLRVNGDGLKGGDSVVEVKLDEDGEVFYCNPAMALQAQHFQEYFDWMPDAQFYVYGKGLLSAIVKRRQENAAELHGIENGPHQRNERVSFIHGGGPSMASYRYRAEIPAMHIGASINDKKADTLIFSKPLAHELMDMARAKARGAWVIVDICDDHFDWPHYKEAIRIADQVICGSDILARHIKDMGREAVVIKDCYEHEERAPHCNGVNLLWFGHAINKHSLERIMPQLEGYPLMVVSNFGGAVAWSPETLIAEFARADIVIIPATARYKGNNRTLEAIRQGCFVVAEPHPSLTDLPGIWVGDIREGIEWARQNLSEANRRISEAQKYVAITYSPKTLASAWRTAIQRPCTLAAEKSTGTDG